MIIFFVPVFRRSLFFARKVYEVSRSGSVNSDGRAGEPEFPKSLKLPAGDQRLPGRSRLSARPGTVFVKTDGKYARGKRAACDGGSFVPFDGLFPFVDICAAISMLLVRKIDESIVYGE